jgi:hypothetical protein
MGLLARREQFVLENMIIFTFHLVLLKCVIGKEVNCSVWYVATYSPEMQ